MIGSKHRLTRVQRHPTGFRIVASQGGLNLPVFVLHTSLCSLSLMLLLAICLYSTGCSSLQVRNTDGYQNEPYVYPATKDRDKLGFPQPITEFIDELEPVLSIGMFFSGRNAFHPESILFGGVAYAIGGVFWVIDKPVALVTDTLVFPYDHYKVRRYSKIAQFWSQVLTNEETLPLPAVTDLRRHNHPRYFDVALRATLDKDVVSHPLLVQLVKADVGSSLIADSRHVDSELGKRLLSTSADTVGVCIILSGNTATPPEVLESILEHCGAAPVLQNLASHPKASPHLLQSLLVHSNADVRVIGHIAQNPNASPDTLMQIIKRSKPEDFHENAVFGVARNPAVTGKLLEAIMTRYPERHNIETLLAGIAKTPAHILWTLARGNDPYVGEVLAKNQAAPPDIIVFLAEHADLRVQFALAGRKNLPLRAQRLLAQNEHPNVRLTLVRNPSVDPDVLLALARNETDPNPLIGLAVLTNAAQEVYLAVAAQTNQNALLELACNKAVSEAVLQNVFVKTTDETSRRVLQNQQASLRTKRLALDALNPKKSYDWIASAILIEDEVIDGIVFMADTEIQFHTNGRVRNGILASDQELSSLDLAAVPFKRGQRISLSAAGRIETRPLLPAWIQGVPCLIKVDAYRSGRLRATTLAEPHTIQGVLFPSSSDIQLYESGAMQVCKLPLDTDILGIPCAHNRPTEFYESGRLRAMTLAEPYTLQGTLFPVGSDIKLFESGALWWCKLLLDIAIQGVSCARNNLIEFYESGRLRAMTLAKAHTFQGTLFPGGSDIKLYESGTLWRCKLSSDTDIQGVPCAHSSQIEFYESGKLRYASAAKKIQWEGITFAAGQHLHFLETGVLNIQLHTQEHYGNAQEHRRRKRLDEALTEYTQALTFNPDSLDVLLDRGNFFLERNNIDAALVDFDHAATLEPQQWWAHHGAAVCRQARHEWDEAIQHFSKAIDLNGPSVSLLYGRAQCLHETGKFMAELDDCKRALELDPTSSLIANYLAWRLVTCPDDAYRDGARALPLAKMAVAQDPSGPHLDTLAAVYAELGNFEQAVKIQEKALAVLEADGPKELLSQFKKRSIGYKKERLWRE